MNYSLTDADARCPMNFGKDERKSAALANASVRPFPDARLADSFNEARAIMRSPDMIQGGAGAEAVNKDNPERTAVFFLDGEAHKRKRAKIARFFTPKAISTRYAAVMESVTERLLSQMRRDGRAQLDWIAFQLAVEVASDIVGLGDAHQAGMARRIEATLVSTSLHTVRGPARWMRIAKSRMAALRFYFLDVKPCIRARRKDPRHDVISHLLEEGYDDKSILIESMTYAAAGMVTTREFITMVCWHLLEKEELRARFLASTPDDQIQILMEILRLEPVAAMLYRRGAQDNQLHGINLREVNIDEQAVGECPFSIDPDRAAKMKNNGAWMSFGDGTHYCPGWQVALHESRVFIDSLLRLPNIRLETPPRMDWNDALMSYELRGAIVTCDKAG